MSSPIFRFTKETKDFFGQNQENKEFFLPDKEALDQSGLKWSTKNGGTTFARNEDGSVDVAIVTTADDDGKAETGLIQLEDIFTVHPNGEVDYRFISEPNAAVQNEESWNKKVQFFSNPKRKSEVLARIKQFIAEKVAPDAPLFSSEYTEAYRAHVKSLRENHKEDNVALLLNLFNTLAKGKGLLEVAFRSPNSFYWSRNKNGKLELTFQYALVNKETKELTGYATDVFLLDPKSHEMESFQRTFEVKKSDGTVSTIKEEDSEKLSKAARDFLEGMKPILTAEGGVLAAETGTKSEGNAAQGKGDEPPAAETKLPVAQKVGDDQFASPLQNQEAKEGPVKALSQDLAILAAAMSEKIDHDADASRGWWNQLTHFFSDGGVIDAAKQRDLVQSILVQVQERRAKAHYPSSIRKTLADLPLSGDLKKVRDKMLDDYVVGQISNISQTRDAELRAHQYLNFVRKDLLASHHLPSTALYIASVFQENKPLEIKDSDGDKGPRPKEAREVAQLIFNELNPESRERSFATTLELGLPRVLDGMAEPEMLGSFAVGSMAGAAVEAAAINRLKGISFLAGEGRLIRLARNALGVGAGIVFGEAPIFTTSNALFNSFSHEAGKLWDKGHLFTEWAQMCLLFGATRMVHGFTGAIVQKMQSKWRWFQKTDDRSLLQRFTERRLGKPAEKPEPQITAGPMGRFPTLEPLPPLNARGQVFSGVLNHGSGIATMQQVMNLYPSLGLTFEGQANRPVTGMDAFLMYGQAVIANNIINGASGGYYQAKITDLKTSARLPKPVVPLDRPKGNEAITLAPKKRKGGDGSSKGKLEPDTQPDDPAGGPDGAEATNGSGREKMDTMRDEEGKVEGPDSGGLQENNLFPGEAHEGHDTYRELFGSAVQGEPGPEPMVDSERAGADTAPETARATPDARGSSQNGARVEIESADMVDDSEPERLPPVDDLVSHPGKTIIAARNMTGWQRFVDSYLLHGAYSALAGESFNVLSAQRSAVAVGKNLYDAAMQWVRYGKTKALDLTRTQEKLHQSEKNNNELKNTLGEKDRKLKAKEGELAEKTGRIAQLEDEVRILTDKSNELDIKLNDETKLLDRTSAKWQGAEARVNTQQETIDSLKESVNSLRELQETLQGTFTKVKALYEEGGEGPANNLRVGELMMKLQQVMSLMQQSDKKLATDLAEKTQLHEQALGELDRLKDQVTVLKDENRSKEEAKNVAEMGQKDSYEKVEAIRQMLKEHLGMEFDADIDKGMQRWIGHIQEQLDKIQDTKTENEESARELQRLQFELADLQAKFDKAQEEAGVKLAERDQTIAAQKAVAEEQEKDLRKAVDGKKAVEGYLRSKSGELEEKEIDLAQAQAEKNATESKNAELQATIDSLSRKIDELNSQFAKRDSAKKGEIEKLSTALESLRGKLAAAQVTIEELKGQNETLSGANLKSQADINELTEKIGELEGKLAQISTDISPETLEHNRSVLENLTYNGNTSEANPASLDPSEPLRPVQIVNIEFSPEGKIIKKGNQAVEFPLARERVKSGRPKTVADQVRLIWTDEGMLWHSATDHLNGRQKAAVADLAQGMAERQSKDPYTVPAFWGEGMGPLARDLYHGLKNAETILNEDGLTTLHIMKQEANQGSFYRAYHNNPNGAEHDDFRNYLKESSSRVGLAKVEVKNSTTSGMVPFEAMTITLHLSELTDADAIRNVFLQMGKLLAKEVTVVFEDGPAGSPGNPGPSGGPRPEAKGGSTKTAPEAAARVKAAAKDTKRPDVTQGKEPEYEDLGNIPEEVLGGEENFPPDARVPSIDGYEGAKKVPSSIPPPPRYRIAAKDAPKILSLRSLQPSEIRMGESSHKNGVPSLFERIREFGELGGATYEGVDINRGGISNDGIGRFIGPDTSLILVNADGVNYGYGDDAARLILKTFKEQIPQGTPIQEIVRLSSKAIDDLLVEKAEGVNPYAAFAAGKVNRPAKPGDFYSFEPYWAGDTKILVQVQVDGEWKLVWQSVDQSRAEEEIRNLSDKDFQDRFGNIPRDLAVRMHYSRDPELTSSINRRGETELATLENGMATDLAEFVVLPDGEKALKLRPGYRIILVSDGGTANEATTEAIVARAAAHKPGQNPAKPYLAENVRRQMALKSAQESMAFHDRVPVNLSDGRDLFTDKAGVVYDAESGGKAVDHLKRDDFSIQVLDFNPLDLKTTLQPALPMPTAQDAPPSTRREGPSPRPAAPQGGQHQSPPPPPVPGQKKSPLPPPPGARNRPASPPAPAAGANSALPKVPPLSSPLPRVDRGDPPTDGTGLPIPLVERKRQSPPPLPLSRPPLPPPPLRSPPPFPGRAALQSQGAAPTTLKAGRRQPPPPPSARRHAVQMEAQQPRVIGPQPPTFDQGSGTLNCGHFLKPIVIGEGKKIGLNRDDPNQPRLNLAKYWFSASDYATLVRTNIGKQEVTLTNLQKDKTIFVKGGNLSSMAEVKPGQSYRVNKGQIICIGTFEIPLDML